MEIQNQRRLNQKSLIGYHQSHQKPEMRREYDLNDPLSLRKELPTRISDADSRLGASSLQKFEGEDLLAEKRSNLQKQQMKAWCAQQAYERKEREKRERDEKIQFENFQETVVQRTDLLQKAADEIRAQRSKMDRLENERLVCGSHMMIKPSPLIQITFDFTSNTGAGKAVA